MWFRRKKNAKSAVSAPQQLATTQSIPKVNSPIEKPQISADHIAKAIVELRGHGAHFGVSYAQMNGYDEKLTNPERFSELLHLMCAEPCFNEANVSFAVRCQIEELESFATNVEGVQFVVVSPELKRLQQEEDRLRYFRQTLAHVRTLGHGNLAAGFEAVGFDFRQFLVNTVTERREADLALVRQKVAEKQAILRPLFLRAYSKGRNKYGEVELDLLFQEAADFLEKFFPEGSLKFFFLAPPLNVVVELALGWVEEAQSNDAQPHDGIDFEHWCAKKIEQQGWSVVVSNASGDQGVDIIASRETVTVVVQCKRYSTPIGNKAIQEVYSGAKHYVADCAVVIGAGGFKERLKNLALSVGWDRLVRRMKEPRRGRWRRCGGSASCSSGMRSATPWRRRGRGFRSSSTSWRHYAGRRARGKRGAGRAAALQHPARRRPARLKPEREADPWH
jgi:hypothetical protein